MPATPASAQKRSNTTPADKPDDQPSVRRKPSAKVEDDGSAKLAGLAYCMLILLGAHTMTLEYKNENNRIRIFQFSCMEGASLAVLAYAPVAKPLALAIMFPPACMKRVSFTVKACYDKDPALCSAAHMFDIQQIALDADLTHMLPHFVKAFAPYYLNLLLTGSLVVFLAALAGLVHPIKTGVLGLLLVVFSCYFTEAAGLLPTIIMQGFLGGFALFYDQKAWSQGKANQEKKIEKKKEDMQATLAARRRQAI